MEVVNSFTLIPGTMANCYDVSYNGKRFLIDAGTKGSGKKIVEYYNALKTKSDIVLITHYHPDHIGGLSLVKETFNPVIYVPDGEIDVVKGQKKMTPASSLMSRFVATVMKSKPVKDVRPVSELKYDGIKVIKSNGHTPDSTSYLFTSLKALFVGDAAMKNGETVTVNRGFTLDYNKALSSIQTLSEEKEATVFPGHGKPFRFDGGNHEAIREE